MVRRQVGEQLDHRVGELEADLEQRLGQPGLGEDLLGVGMRREVLHVEHLAARRAEHQVLGERGVGVVALLVEHLDEPGEARLGEPLAHRPARGEEQLGELGLRLGIDRAAQPHLVDVAVELHDGQRLDRERGEILGTRQAERRVVDPVGRAVVGRVARALGLVALALVLLGAARPRARARAPAGA